MKYVRIIPYTIYLWSIGYEVLQLSAEGYNKVIYYQLKSYN